MFRTREFIFRKTVVCNVMVWYVLHAPVTTVTHKLTKLHGLSPRANYTDRAAAAGRRS
jgi:hypothetical protein